MTPSLSSEMPPVILLDTYDEGYCEERGYVEATVSEDEARKILAEFCFDDDEKNYVPDHGPAKRVWLVPDDPESPEQWLPGEPTAPNAMEFWDVPVV